MLKRPIKSVQVSRQRLLMDPIKANTPPHPPPPPQKKGAWACTLSLSLSLSLSLPDFINRNLPTLSYFLMGWNKTCSHGLVKTEM